MVYQKYSPYACDSTIVNFNFALCNSLRGGLQEELKLVNLQFI
jgi:hypothetical protein